MTGWNTIQRIRSLEEQANGLGLKFTNYKHDESIRVVMAIEQHFGVEL